MGQSSTKFKIVSHDKADLRLRCLALTAVGAKRGVYRDRYETFAELQQTLRSGPSKQMLASKYFANILKALTSGDGMEIIEGSADEIHQPGTWRQPAHLPPVEQMLAALRAVKIPSGERKKWKAEVRQRKREQRAKERAEREEKKKAEREEAEKQQL